MPDQKQIKVLLVDDEPLARNTMRIYLEDTPDFTIIGEAGNGKAALQSINELKPDLVLLDIEMPELSGMDMIKYLSEPIPKIVFITAYQDYAIQAFDEDAIDYILKPFSKERFKKMLTKVKKKFNSNSVLTLEEIEKTILKLHNSRYLKKISIKSRGKILFIPIEDILWVESEGSITKLHLESKTVVSGYSMKELEGLLNPNLHIRIHKSNMVNIDAIESIESFFHGEYIITMKDGTDLKLSRGYKDRLEKIMNQYSG